MKPNDGVKSTFPLADVSDIFSVSKQNNNTISSVTYLPFPLIGILHISKTYARMKKPASDMHFILR